MSVWRLVTFIVCLALMTSLTAGSNMGTSIEAVKNRHVDQLMAMPDVISVGIGKNGQGVPAIIVGMDKENVETQSSIPDTVEGYPVEIRIIGPVRAH